MHSASHESAVNLLTGGGFDVQTHTPAYKQVKVRMQILEETGTIPLPRYNPRFAKRNPQLGVQVERKWARADYEPISDVNVAGGRK
jgi:formate dehydrogenase major subunit